MTAEDLIFLLKRQVCGGAIESAMSSLDKVPDNDPNEIARERTAWFHRQNQPERALLKNVITGAVEQAIFNLLAILDDVAAINDQDFSDRLELHSVSNGRSIRLNDPAREELHRIFAQCKEVTDEYRPGNLKVHQVGTYSSLRKLLSAEDRLHLHRVPIKSAARRLIASYDPTDAPCIALPQDAHREVESSDPGTKVPTTH